MRAIWLARGLSMCARTVSQRRFFVVQIAWGLLPILVAGVLLRVWQLERWLPAYYEEAVPVLRAVAFWDDFDFAPGFYNYPALSFYMQFLAQCCYFLWTWVQGGSLTEFRQQLDALMPTLVLLGRWVTLLSDLGAVVAVFFLGTKVGDERVGLLAAAMVACNSLHVRLSQYVLVDVPLGFCVVLALGWIVDLSRAATRSVHLKAGSAVGLAAAVKYTAGLLIVPLAVAALVGDRLQIWHRLLLAALASLAVFFALNPYILWHFDAFWADFSYEREHMALGHFGHDRALSSLNFYATELLAAVGVVGLAALWAVVGAVRRRETGPLLLCGWVGLYLTVVVSWEMRAARYLLPVVPVLLLLGARALLHDVPQRWRRAAIAAALVLYLGGQAWGLRMHYATLAVADTHAEVGEWMAAHLPPGALVAIEHYTYYPDRDAPAYVLFRLPIDVVRPERFSGFYAHGWYENFDYVLLSSAVYRRYLEDPERFPTQVAFYRHLAAEWHPLRRFAPQTGSGVEIAVFENPRSDRPDRPFATELYHNLSGIELELIAQFLSDLQHALAARGYGRRADSIGATAALIQRLHQSAP